MERKRRGFSTVVVFITALPILDDYVYLCNNSKYCYGCSNSQDVDMCLVRHLILHWKQKPDDANNYKQEKANDICHDEFRQKLTECATNVSSVINCSQWLHLNF
jgi:hypothetical protein